MILPCARCGDDFDTGRRRASHYCKSCRAERKADYDRERASEYRRLVRDVTANVAEWRASGGYDSRADAYGIVASLTSVYETRPGMRVPMVSDRPPKGWSSNAGPNDGVSTWFIDLAVELDVRQAAALCDPWWTANPHWNVQNVVS